MALRKLAGIALRPRELLLLAASVIVAQTTIGCSHNRASYRPIYAAPAAVPVAAPPCNGCGPDAPISPVEPGGAPSSSVPLLPEAPGEVNVPPVSGPAQAGNGPTRSSTVETPPKARIGSEPDYDPLPPARAGGNGRSSSSKPSNSGSGPSLLGPNGAPSAKW